MDLRTMGTTNPFGKETVGLKGPNGTARRWRLDKIKEAERKGEKTLLVKAGEFGKGMIETVKYALDKKFTVTVVSGNEPNCESKEEIIKFLTDFPETFKYYVLDNRPDDHFNIIGQSDLFIEVPHASGATTSYSIGITEAYDYIITRYEKKFTDTIKSERAKYIDPKKEEDLNFVKGLPCLLIKNN